MRELIGCRALLAASIFLTTGGAAVGETSSWQQRVEPSAKAAPPARKAKAPQRVKSEIVEPGAVPKGALKAPGGSGPTPKLPSLGPATAPTVSIHAKDGAGSDPAYEAFEQGKYLTALRLAEELAGRGDPTAHTLIARIHAEGLGVPRNPAVAAQWYAKGVELGDIEAAAGLGALHAQGAGVEKDFEAAARYFEMAASKGHPVAAYNLALLFLAGKGKVENPYRGFGLMQHAAERGVVAAQYDLGTLYSTGTGTEPNAFEAARWIGKAAAQGHVEAEVEFAVILFKGHGTPPDEKRGAALFRSAAEKGVAVAQNRLARCYAHGRGVDKDLVESLKWHLLAKSGGLDDEALDAMLARLPRADRAKAETAAADWSAQRLLE